jgi:hypothetical protein
MDKLDYKRFICGNRNPKAAQFVADALNRNSLPPLSKVFAESACETLENDSQKAGKIIIQFGFLITDPTRGVELTTRAELNLTKPAGHSMTTGYSVVIGWSPIFLPTDRTFPQNLKDVSWIYHEKVEEEAGSPEPTFQFLGVVGNRIKNTNYLFYVFSAAYPIRNPGFKRLKKDLTDRVLGIHPVDETLFAKIADGKVSLRALEAFAGLDLSHYGYGESVFVKATDKNRLP